MKMKNSEVMPFGRFLYSLSATGKNSRMRTRLIKVLEEKLDGIKQELNQIYLEHADRTAGDMPKTEIVDGLQVYVFKDKEACHRDVQEFFKEEYFLENSVERKDMLLAVKDLVLETDEQFSGNDAELYDRYCEIVESIEY